MSLKHFHIAFVAICVISAWAFAAWCLAAPGLDSGLRGLGVVSFLGGVALLVYGVRFYRKIKDLVL